ncbi:MAG TPA: HAMP domain-containing sensor histidine kinase [Gammaproteobacteria bacterium]
MSSIQGKIRLAYGTVAAVVLAFVALSYGDLRYLERQIEEGEAIFAFQRDTLEMRRHEKNLLLYGSAADHAAAVELAGDLRRRTQGTVASYTLIAKAEDITTLSRDLDRYAALLTEQRVRLIGGQVPAAVEADVRALGHAISERANAFSQQERQAMSATVAQSKAVLLWSLLLVVLLGIWGGHILSRIVVRPLRRLESSLRPISEGRFAHVPLVSQDRELVSFTNALNLTLDELEARRRQVLNSEKLASIGVLASGMAHELNNPLGNISSSCQLLLEEWDSADTAQKIDWLEQIDSETERARRIVDTLLQYGRQRDFRPEHLDLRKVLEKVLILMGRYLPSRDTIRMDIAPGMGLCADEQRLKQIFINLIKNALDAGGRHVHIDITAHRGTTAECMPPAGAHVLGDLRQCMGVAQPATVIVFSDDGPGIDTEHLSRIFDPFFTTRSPGHGVGLGLYVVAEIVQEHGGCIAVERRAEGGARFTLWFPCAQEISA